MSILKPLAIAEAKLIGGKKMKRIGQARRSLVAETVAEGISRNASVDTLAQNLKEKANTETGRDKRDWRRVAQTEVTDAKARASLDLIENVFGKDAKVFRRVNPKCCSECAAMYGKPPKYKQFTASKIPEKARGALHPNCICGPWSSIEQPDLTKAMSPLEDIPVGYVKMQGDHAIVSTGNGYWARLDSITGRAIIQSVLMHTPLVIQRESLGFTVMRHGHLKADKSYIIVPPTILSSCRFYPMDLGSTDDQELRVRGMTDLHTLDEYVKKMKAALPTVATMPNFWDGVKVRYLTDFLGYKTLTDWTIVFPGKPKEQTKLSARLIGVRRAVRRYTRNSLEINSLRKRA